MKFQVGDRVLVLHSGEEGEVVDIINDQMVSVNVEGVIFPAYIDQLDFPYYKQFTEKNKETLPAEKKYIDAIKKELPESLAKNESGVWLSFLPVLKMNESGEEVVELLKIHLLNQTYGSFDFIYELHFFGEPDFDLKNELHPFEDFYLHDILFDAMNDSPSFEFKFMLKSPGKDKAEYYETSFRLKPKQLFLKLQELKDKSEASFSFRLFERYPDKAVDPALYFPEEKKLKSYDLSKAKQQWEPARSVIDLHIEQLIGSPAGLSNFDILTIQLKTFEKYYDLAVLHMQPSLIVIHGVGSGKLKSEIHALLPGRKEIKSWNDQYHPLYGYGATEILFQY